MPDAPITLVAPMRRSLIVLARAPERGCVKTRLAAAVGADEALAIYRELGTRVVARTAGATCARIVAFTPDDAEAPVRTWLGDSLACVPQGAGDLGARMERAIERRLASGDERVVVIGTDCPALSAADVDAAFAALDHADVVFGPAADGGYYLVGMRRFHPAIFRDVPWSAPDTLAVSLARAADASLRVARLRVLADIDTIEDLRAWRAEEA